MRIFQLADGEVVLALEGATLCNSDLHTLTGRYWPGNIYDNFADSDFDAAMIQYVFIQCRRKEPTPTVLGHEGCGTVVLSRRSQRQ